MNIRNSVRTLVAAFAFAVAAQVSAAPMLLVDSSGILTGAKNVDVAGTLYNVTFADGSCNALFNNCNPSAFTFHTFEAAISASQALLDQVFVDGSTGAFGTIPSKTIGCSAPTCATLIPFSHTFTNLVRVAISYNTSTVDSLSNDNSYYPLSVDTQDYMQVNYAIFQPAASAATVPEPNSIALIAIAIVGFGFRRRKKE